MGKVELRLRYSTLVVYFKQEFFCVTCLGVHCTSLMSMGHT